MNPTSTSTAEMPSTASLFREFADGVYTLGHRVLGDRQLAEDAVQETFIKVMKSLHTYRGDGPLAGWLYRIGYRETIAIARRRRDQPMDADLLNRELPPSAENVEKSVVEHELADRLDKAIGALTDPLRGAFALRDIEGLSTAEVAVALEISESAVKMRLARAREALRIELQEYLP
jgi:RNA polymerase sigma-70 factor (ECF subfamily)